MTNEVPENIMPENTELPPEPGTIGDPSLGMPEGEVHPGSEFLGHMPTEVNDNDPLEEA